MKRMTRTILAAVGIAAATFAMAAPGTATASVGSTVYIDGIAYEDGGTFGIGDGDSGNDAVTDTLDGALTAVLAVAKPVTCVPKATSTTIHRPNARVYYGSFDSIYTWSGLVEAEVTGCPDNTVTVRARMRDQALDGSSLPAEGYEASATGKGRAGVVAELMQRYNNIVMATGLSYHTLTTTVTASQTDGRTTTVWCSTKSWTYVATLAGPQLVGETPTEKVKCAP